MGGSQKSAPRPLYGPRFAHEIYTILVSLMNETRGIMWSIGLIKAIECPRLIFYESAFMKNFILILGFAALASACGGGGSDPHPFERYFGDYYICDDESLSTMSELTKLSLREAGSTSVQVSSDMSYHASTDCTGDIVAVSTITYPTAEATSPIRLTLLDSTLYSIFGSKVEADRLLQPLSGLTNTLTLTEAGATQGWTTTTESDGTRCLRNPAADESACLAPPSATAPDFLVAYHLADATGHLLVASVEAPTPPFTLTGSYSIEGAYNTDSTFKSSSLQE